MIEFRCKFHWNLLTIIQHRPSNGLVPSRRQVITWISTGLNNSIGPTARTNGRNWPKSPRGDIPGVIWGAKLPAKRVYLKIRATHCSCAKSPWSLLTVTTRRRPWCCWFYMMFSKLIFILRQHPYSGPYQFLIMVSFPLYSIECILGFIIIIFWTLFWIELLMIKCKYDCTIPIGWVQI